MVEEEALLELLNPCQETQVDLDFQVDLVVDLVTEVDLVLWDQFQVMEDQVIHLL